jgi:acetylornithine deacetylase/succinyl-diaminopimelate desuccinylase-like protein
MKGNLLMAVLGVESVLREEGALPLNIKFIFEGQEEIGSPQLPDFVAGHKDLLAADLVLNADGGQAGEDQPSLTLGLRGETGLQIDVYGANSDLHSGGYGGAVANPLHALVRILDSMRAPDGRITVEGFYDDVAELTEQDRQDFAALPFDEAEYFGKLGVTEGFGEPGFSPREQVWARPTLELNGMWGGFQGVGIKTVLPKEAHAKITCRLVKNQDPEKILAALIRHIEQNTPPGVRVEIDPLPFFAQPYLMPKDHWGNTIVAAVLEEEYGKAPHFKRSGGTVPVMDVFLSNLSAYSVGLGFGLDDENVHAPNEFLRVASFERGQRVWARVLQRLGKEAPEKA